MKKILTTTVITAILATSGFAGQTEPVEEWVYGTATFPSGTDNNPTTIMPSGTVNIGSDSAMPTIASEWILKEGSVMNVTGNGFILQNELTINPKDAGIPVQCAIGEQLYYEYEDVSNSSIKYYKLVGSDGSAGEMYLDSNGEELITQPTTTPNQVKTTDITGSPFTITGAIINMNYDSGTQKVKGCISGGTVTYAPKGAIILSKDSKTDFADDSSLKEKTKYTMAAAGSAGFQETYLSCLPVLHYCSGDPQNLDFSQAPAAEKIASSNTLQEYLNSFGFYPDPVTVLDGNGIGFNLLTLKGDDAAIQIPKYIGFSTAASGTKYEVKTNLHNVDAAFDSELTFIGTGAGSATIDTLEFSGDNSNLTPEYGVTYSDVNVTFDCANSWIAAPKNQAVTFVTSDGVSSTVTINNSMSIHSNLTIRERVSLVGPENTIIKLFGSVTLGGAAG